MANKHPINITFLSGNSFVLEDPITFRSDCWCEGHIICEIINYFKNKLTENFLIENDFKTRAEAENYLKFKLEDYLEEDLSKYDEFDIELFHKNKNLTQEDIYSGALEEDPNLTLILINNE